eukprot:Hpha_TRINITY_DN16190_c1_g3::TRINITY_DN16190_c1_g3_i1::g.5063::m.5063
MSSPRPALHRSAVLATPVPRGLGGSGGLVGSLAGGRGLPPRLVEETGVSFPQRTLLLLQRLALLAQAHFLLAEFVLLGPQRTLLVGLAVSLLLHLRHAAVEVVDGALGVVDHPLGGVLLVPDVAQLPVLVKLPAPRVVRGALRLLHTARELAEATVAVLQLALHLVNGLLCALHRLWDLPHDLVVLPPRVLCVRLRLPRQLVLPLPLRLCLLQGLARPLLRRCRCVRRLLRGLLPPQRPVEVPRGVLRARLGVPLLLALRREIALLISQGRPHVLAPRLLRLRLVVRVAQAVLRLANLPLGVLQPPLRLILVALQLVLRAECVPFLVLEARAEAAHGVDAGLGGLLLIEGLETVVQTVQRRGVQLRPALPLGEVDDPVTVTVRLLEQVHDGVMSEPKLTRLKALVELVGLNDPVPVSVQLLVRDPHFVIVRRLFRQQLRVHRRGLEAGLPLGGVGGGREPSGGARGPALHGSVLPGRGGLGCGSGGGGKGGYGDTGFDRSGDVTLGLGVACGVGLERVHLAEVAQLVRRDDIHPVVGGLINDLQLRDLVGRRAGPPRVLLRGEDLLDGVREVTQGRCEWELELQVYLLPEGVRRDKHDVRHLYDLPTPLSFVVTSRNTQ